MWLLLHTGACSLASAKFMLVNEDASIFPFSQLYQGPYRVLGRQDKFFTLEMGSRMDTVSIDRLKPVLSPKQRPHRGQLPRACPSCGSTVLSSVSALGPVLAAVSAPVRQNPL